MAATELTENQREAVVRFAAALQEFGAANEALVEAGLSPADALRSIPTTDGRTMYDELPASIRLML